MKRLITAAALIAIALAAGTRVPAFSTNGVSWALDQVPYYVNPANGDLPADTVIAAVQTGALGWSMQSNAAVSLYYMGTTNGTALQNNGKNEVFFRNASAGSMVAETYWWADASGHLIDADIVFYDGGWKFFAGTTGCVSGVYVEDVATHEFGHALGLNHSGDSAATMYPSTTNCLQNWRSLALDDQLAIESVYSTAKPPAAPANLTATFVSGTTTALAWNDMSSSESGFSVKRSVNGGTWGEIARLAANLTSYSDPSAPAGSLVSYQVAAFNGSGSAASNVASVSVPAAAPTAPPAAPAGPSPANGAVNVSVNADLYWGSTAGATGYDVYFGTSSAPPFLSSASASTLALPRLSAGVKYYWRVVARNSLGSTTSATWSFTTKASGKR